MGSRYLGKVTSGVREMQKLGGGDSTTTHLKCHNEPKISCAGGQ